MYTQYGLSRSCMRHHGFGCLLALLMLPLPGCLESKTTAEATCRADDTNCQNPPHVPNQLQAPRLYTDPPFGLTFTCTVLDCAEVRELVIENRGGGLLGIHRITLQEENSNFRMTLVRRRADDFETVQVTPSANDPIRLDIYDKIIVKILYRPNNHLADDTALLITWSNALVAYNDQTLEHVTLPIRAPQTTYAQPSLETSEINFGYVALGQTSTQNLILRNKSASAAILGVTDVAWEASGDMNFEYGMGWPSVADPQQTIEIPITYKPTETKASYAISLVTIHPEQPPLEIRVKGTSIPHPQPAFVNGSHHTLDFGHIRLGESQTQMLQIRNAGASDARIDAVVMHGDSNTIYLEYPHNEVVPALGQFWIRTTLTPSAGGPIRATVRLTLTSVTPAQNNEDISAHYLDVQMTGECDAPALVVEPSTLAFPPLALGWTSKHEELRLYNRGSGPLHINHIDFIGEAAALFRLASIPQLPTVIMPEQAPLKLPMSFHGLAMGVHQAVLRIQTNALSEPIIEIPLTAKVATCAQICPAAHATVHCDDDQCSITQCNAGWRDTNQSPDDGCECAEDPGNGNQDIGASCSGAMMLGRLGDTCSSYPSQKIISGSLHALDDIDVFHFSAEDAASPICDIFGDTATVEVSLSSDTPDDIVVCIDIQSGVDAPCGNYTDHYRQDICRRSHAYRGSYGGDDTRSVTAWVLYKPGAAPQCGEYTIRVNANNN